MITSPPFRPEAEAAGAIACLAGELLKNRFATAMEISFKGTTDLVTEMDLAAEALIRSELARVFPRDRLFGEEGGGDDFRDGRVWVFDPLDGTTNFTHGLPIFSVSIALCVDGRPRAGAIRQPMTGETFMAWAGGGASRNGCPIKVSSQEVLGKALAVTGFPYSVKDTLEEVVGRLRKMILATQGIRRLGSAAMDLCYVAMGRFDLFWEAGLEPWDVAAGAVIVEEAGGRVTDFSGCPMALDRGQILATNQFLHPQAQTMLAP